MHGSRRLTAGGASERPHRPLLHDCRRGLATCEVSPRERRSHSINLTCPLQSGHAADIRRGLQWPLHAALNAETGVQVADLLECVLQISALRHTTSRLAETAVVQASGHRSGPAEMAPELAAALVAAEEDFSVRLVTALPRGPSLDICRDRTLSDESPPWQAADVPFLGRFLMLRRANLAILDRCSAEDLSRPLALRGVTRSVADLVADALARDTDALGALRGGPNQGCRPPRFVPSSPVVTPR
jgi:hypothetical protein